MKRLLMLLAVAMMLATGVDARLLRPTSVGLYLDAEHEGMSMWGEGEFPVYVWWLSGEGGLNAGSFILHSPMNAAVLNIAVNPIFEEYFGCVNCFCFSAPEEPCQYGWVWSHRIQFRLLDSTPGFIEILPCGDETAVQVKTCYPGFPAESAVVVDKIGLNRAPVLAAHLCSWGAIKAFYR